MTGYDYRRPLEVAVDAALAAGAILRADFHRPDGPRGEGDHAESDTEAEEVIRRALVGAFPGWGYRGEETGFAPRAAGESHLWLVDPNDGTRAYLKGSRGSAVSIALLRDGQPVLGVVYAFAAPDDDGDLFSWAEGTGRMRRNGQEVVRPTWPTTLSPYDVILLSEAMGRKVAVNLELAAPARCRPMTSVAYRMALAAAGDAAVAVSLNAPGGWDYAAGHALILAEGGELVDEGGIPVRYSADGQSRTRFCFGGAPALVREMAARDWGRVRSASEDPREAYDLVRPARGQAVRDAGVLLRAQGCLLGQLAGDALGSLVEFQSAEDIARAYPDGVRALADGGVWNSLAGQPTDDSELALALARSVVKAGRYEQEAAAAAYGHWYRSGPFDCGSTTRQALGTIRPEDASGGQAASRARAAASPASQANGSLMRVSPLGIWGTALHPDVLGEYARADSALTHPNPVCCDAAAVFTVAVARAISTGARPAEVYEHALDWATQSKCSEAVLRTVKAAPAGAPVDFTRQQGWVLIALQNAFHQVLHAPTAGEGIVSTVMRGGDTDTNAAIAGALLGAVHGRGAIPQQWRQMVLTCRPLMGLVGVVHPRPRAFWPVDALELAERLLYLGRQVGR